MKVKISIVVSVFLLLALITFSQIENKPFAPARDFPRDALIYVQIADLPAIIKLWNESEFKETYTESDNFQDFKNRHLGRKLASRWNEFNAATGFPIDLETVAKLADNQAAMAIYDIGKLEFVFIAPVSDEIFAATNFFRNRGNYTAETLLDGIAIYRANVKADRGRQKQKLIFANVKNRFVLATSEKLFAQTLNNINGANGKNRLIDEPLLTNLSENFTPHSATVWVNQTVLNNDYYFKRYWLMSDVKDLKNIRAGLFDFEMREGKYIERRRFLLDKNIKTSPIPVQQTEKLLSYTPENTVYYRLLKTSPKTIDETIKQTVSQHRKIVEQSSENQFYHSGNDDYSDGSYENLSADYDEMIDDGDEKTLVESKTAFDFSKVLAAAKPTAVLTFTTPKVLPAPLFVEFRRAAIYHLDAPDNFDRTAFETAIEREISENVLISSPGVKLNWATKIENDVSRRELNAPLIGWSVGYVLRGSQLILTNNGGFTSEIIAVENPSKYDFAGSPITGLTVINLDGKENSYDRIFAELAGKNSAQTFFTDNVGSLLDSISDVERIEIRQDYSQKILREDITFVLR